MSTSSTKNRLDDLTPDLRMKIISNIITFPNTPVTFGAFFKMNNLDNDRYKGCTFTLTGDPKDPRSTRTFIIAYDGDLKENPHDYNYPYLRDEHRNYYKFNLFDASQAKKLGYKPDLVNEKFEYYQSHPPSHFYFDEDDGGGVMAKSYHPSHFHYGEDDGGGVMAKHYQTITKLVIKKEIDGDVIFTADKDTLGGSKKSVKKEILGKLRCIYKIHGSRKEYVKHKGMLITVTDYKKKMKQY